MKKYAIISALAVVDSLESFQNAATFMTIEFTMSDCSGVSELVFHGVSTSKRFSFDAKYTIYHPNSDT